MKELPKGCYAVAADFENAPKDAFTYKGVTYAVTAGVNLFGSVAEAAAAAVDVPDTAIEGVPCASFDTPVLLFSVGKHTFDKFSPDRSLTLLGEGAGINPNVAGTERGELPTLAPARERENESVMYGSYWHGKVIVTAAEAKKITFDGFSSLGVSFRDLRDKGGNCSASFRNMVHLTPCGYVLYLFRDAATESDLCREVEFSHIRIVDFDDYDYKTVAFQISAAKTMLDDVCYARSLPSFGFSDLVRGKNTGESNLPRSSVTLKNSYFAELDAHTGIGTAGRNAKGNALDFTVENCVFRNAARKNEAALFAYLPTNDSTLTVSGCLFEDTRGNANAAVETAGEEGTVTLADNEARGFAALSRRAPRLTAETVPLAIENHAARWVTQTEDPHTVLGTDEADFTALDARYEGCRAYYGDLHVHTACGGTSDGAFPMSSWVAEMDRLHLDFAAVVDHRQMRGFFLPEWSEERFIIGTEPGTALTEGMNAVRLGKREVHYNMLFPHKYGLAMVLANFPEFEFRGDELTGSFKYPHFTKERFCELARYVQSIGGIFVHPHPKTMLSSDDPDDYYFGEHTFLETLYGAPSTGATFGNYELWCALLAEGKHVYASCGSDTHGNVSNAAVATFYTKERSGRAFFDQMRTADFAVGKLGIKMCVEGHPMGSEIPYREGMKLTLRTDDPYLPRWQENGVFELRVLTDRGTAYVSRFRGTAPQALSLEVQKRAFYRVEIFDLANGVLLGHGNPIFLD